MHPSITPLGRAIGQSWKKIIGQSAIRTHIADITASIEAHVGPAAAAAAAMAIATNVREEEGDEELHVAKHGPHTAAAAKRV